MITLAIPSKGRLKEQALEVLAKAGLAVSLPGDERLSRPYRARKHRSGLPVGFRDIQARSAGRVDLGITGEDLVRENLVDWEARAEIVAVSASAAPMWWSRCLTSGSTSTPWPTSMTSPPIFASAMAGGCASPPNTGG